ncbi:MAG: hypothetical protein AAF035_03165 [Pseudomonadota bacterium]
MSALTACQSTPPVKLQKSESAQSLMLRVGKQVQACWFKTKDPAFRRYRMADELNSYTGKPRLLIVPRNNPGGLPKLVAEAQRKGGRVQFSAYGPLIDGKDGPRFSSDLKKWASGRTTC